MADRYPLVVDQSNFRIEEIPSGDDLNLVGSEIKGAEKIGIGTSAPSYPAHINQRVFVEDLGGVFDGDGSTPIDISTGLSNDIVNTAHRIRTGGGLGRTLKIEAANDSSVGYGVTEGSIDGRVEILTRNQVRISIGASGEVGIGTTWAGEKLQVNGNLRIGFSTQENYIAFHGLAGDGANRFGPGVNQSTAHNLYTHTFIGERNYHPPGGSVGVGTTQTGREAAELLIYKADNSGREGEILSVDELKGYSRYLPDRIRLQGGSIVFCTHPDIAPAGSSRTGNFTDVGLHTGPSRMEVFATGNVGFGTTLPRARVHIGPVIPDTIPGLGTSDAALRVDGNIQVGFNTGANYISFHGVTSDGAIGAGVSQGSYRLYSHCAIGERVYPHDNGTEMSELLLFKGNDTDNSPTVGPDRIRHLAPSHIFETIPDGVSGLNPGTFDDIQGNFTPTRCMEIKDNGQVIIGAGLSVGGAVSKGSGSFRIPHPIAEDRDLVHSFVEGPQADLIYRGKVTLVGGTATVNLDENYGLIEGTWEALCRDPQVFVQNNAGWTAVRGSVSGPTVTITAQESSCTDEIDWMVVAERQDDNIKNANWTDENGRPILEPFKA